MSKNVIKKYQKINFKKKYSIEKSAQKKQNIKKCQERKKIMAGKYQNVKKTKFSLKKFKNQKMPMATIPSTTKKK